ncbi:zinc-binding dehydrogenase [Actinosynnema sp. NPDC047251]|uniref:Alcohol dehydrogenase zinc-binding domain-containing protein n=1 Tax=Saccharothrix espanaensis (strain ATCC 51144 / DSM 44229 / JCM 9112 / NBRC 15066 / NRRL 15764) TaxID=1179773 RepID=K0K844_SACES|nr:zinc-binding dehydrogenase [Saccharothrix espanaensis]CCH33692.1 Alcohol dehydrogenase zinc-binding domain-containing protein [Saccharothrix espanaensis DSM 44229]
MRAVWLTGFGGPEVLVAGEAPDPVAGPGQVLVEVAYANITFVETQYRATGRGPFGIEPPGIPGNGVGGVVTGVGPGVDPGLVGQRVVTSTGGSGGYAERAAVDAAGVVVVPDGVPLDTAVALLADGRTALLNLRAVGPVAGQRVLVLAAAGGVGTLLVQLAKAAGATVVGAAGGPDKGEVVRGLGADDVVDYLRPDWARRAGPVDVVFDGVGGPTARAAFELLTSGGRMLSYGLASGEWAAVDPDRAAARGVVLVAGDRPTPELVRELVADVLRQAARGAVRPVVGQRFPLAQAAAAHAVIESRATVGKTLLEVR